MEKYTLIPQWMMRNNKLIGIRNLYKVETVGSDYWIKQRKNKYDVYEPYLRERLLICDTADEAIEFIRDITLIYGRVAKLLKGE